MAYAGENMNSRVHDGSAENPVENRENAIVIEATGLKKSFRTSDGVLDVLNGVNLRIRSGEMVSVVGESGAGKSTLLHILGGLDRSSGGTLKVCGRSYSEMDDDELAEFRNRNIGFVFQFHHLMADFSAVENVMIPLLIRGDNPTESRERASYLLESMGLSGRATHRPGKLSGGEQQRVAVARALAADPQIVLADEPSGNLDEKTASSLHDTLLELSRNSGTTFVIATHNREFAARADMMYELSGGLTVPVNGGGR